MEKCLPLPGSRTGSRTEALETTYHTLFAFRMGFSAFSTDKSKRFQQLEFFLPSDHCFFPLQVILLVWGVFPPAIDINMLFRKLKPHPD